MRQVGLHFSAPKHNTAGYRSVRAKTSRFYMGWFWSSQTLVGDECTCMNAFCEYTTTLALHSINPIIRVDNRRMPRTSRSATTACDWRYVHLCSSFDWLLGYNRRRCLANSSCRTVMRYRKSQRTFLPPDAMQAWPVPSCGVCPTVRPPVTFVHFVKTNKRIFKFVFHRWMFSLPLPLPIHSSFSTPNGMAIFQREPPPPLTGASNAGGVGRNRDSYLASLRGVNAATGQLSSTRRRKTRVPQVVTLIGGSKGPFIATQLDVELSWVVSL